MTTFREQQTADMVVFFNLDEFAEVHRIYDWITPEKEIDCIMDRTSFSERKREPIELYHAANGVYVTEVILYCRSIDFGYTPVTDQKLMVDGVTYSVVESIEQAGVLEIKLGANQA